MAEYFYASMTDSDALFIGPNDIINVAVGSANQTTVIFNDNFTYTVTINGKTLTFGHSFHDVVDATPRTSLLFPDNSVLYVGDGNDNRVDLIPDPQQPHDGGAYGGPGADMLTTTAGNWLIQGNQGADSITASNGQDTVYGGQDNDVIRFAGTAHPNFGQGNKGNDSLSGNSAADTLLGGQGNDTINGLGSADFINGNLGNDSLLGSGQLLGEDGNDTFAGGFATDTTMRGGAGEDSISTFGSPSSGFMNTIFGDDGNDVIVSNSFRHDELFGGAGNDTISSTNSPSNVGDLLDGGDGSDSLLGSEGIDTLSGGNGADTLNGAHFGDTLFGGGGADVFVMTDVIGGIGPIQDDQIIDWEVIDRIQLNHPFSGRYAEFTATNLSEGVTKADDMLHDPSLTAVSVQIGSDVWVFFADGAGSIASAAILVGRNLNDISADNFV